MKPGIVVGMPNQLLSQCSVFFLEDCERERKNWIFSDETFFYSVCLNFIYPIKELCSKMALGEVGVSLPW